MKRYLLIIIRYEKKKLINNLWNAIAEQTNKLEIICNSCK